MSCPHLQPELIGKGFLLYPSPWDHTHGVWFDTPTSAGLLELACGDNWELPGQPPPADNA